MVNHSVISLFCLFVCFLKQNKTLPEGQDVLTDGNSSTSQEMENTENGEDTKDYHLSNEGRREGKVEFV